MVLRMPLSSRQLRLPNVQRKMWFQAMCKFMCNIKTEVSKGRFGYIQLKKA